MTKIIRNYGSWYILQQWMKLHYRVWYKRSQRQSNTISKKKKHFKKQQNSKKYIIRNPGFRNKPWIILTWFELVFSGRVSSSNSSSCYWHVAQNYWQVLLVINHKGEHDYYFQDVSMVICYMVFITVNKLMISSVKLSKIYLNLTIKSIVSVALLIAEII